MRVRDDEQQLFVGLSDLENEAERLAALRSTQRASAMAASAGFAERFEQAVGKTWDGGERRNGKPKSPSGTIQHEAGMIRNNGTSGKAT